jgi:hypothetical protein
MNGVGTAVRKRLGTGKGVNIWRSSLGIRRLPTNGETV